MRQDGRMRLRIFTEPQQGASYATLRQVATTAEALGFDGFFRSDHYLKMGDGDGQPGPTGPGARAAARRAARRRPGAGAAALAAAAVARPSCAAATAQTGCRLFR